MLSKYMIWLFKRGCWWLLVLIIVSGFATLPTHSTSLAQDGSLACGMSHHDASGMPWVFLGFSSADPCPIPCTDVTVSWNGGIGEGNPTYQCNDGGGDPPLPPDKPGVMVGSVCQGDHLKPRVRE